MYAYGDPYSWDSSDSSTDSQSDEEEPALLAPPPPPPPAPVKTLPKIKLVLPSLRSLKQPTPPPPPPEPEPEPEYDEPDADADADADADYYYEPELPPVAGPSTLRVPASPPKKARPKPKNKLKFTSAAKLKRKRQPLAFGEQLPPKILKLKPLKEVLARLMVAFKKKDDYAFFLRPVNAAQVPGYAELIKRPMDFGTMTVKVQRGRYKSLEEFTEDFRLVTGNSKLFNPPDSIYYTEAEKIETWGLDQIAKAAPTVIQNDSDWNLEPENEEGATEDLTAEDYAAALALEDATEVAHERSRSPSASLGIGGTTHLAMLRRGPRAIPKPAADGTVPEKATIDAEGRLPGSKEGLGAFPAGSDWARTILVLKLRAKRYKTKKERIRIETYGPPALTDGSLDYFAIEDPFSYLSQLAPEPLSRPYLTPIFPPPQPLQPSVRETPAPEKETPAPVVTAPYPLPTLLPPRPPPQTLRSAPIQTSALVDKLAGVMNAALVNAGLGTTETQTRDEAEALVKSLVKQSVDVGARAAGMMQQYPHQREPDYWGTERRLEAAGYIADVVYGGVEGLAYVRSLAEFVGTPPLDVDDGVGEEDVSGAGEDVKMEEDGNGDVKLEDEDVKMVDASSKFPLGCSLASYVEKTIVGPLTEGRHRLLTRTAREVAIAVTKPKSEPGPLPSDDTIAAQVALAINVRPMASTALRFLQTMLSYKLDMAALMKVPEDVESSDAEWAGAKLGVGAAQMPTGLQTKAVLDHTADVIAKLGTEGSGDAESKTLRDLRLNLLALVRRAPADTIAVLPAELVPENLRQFVPTLPLGSAYGVPQAQAA
ncbi:Bromodomain-containing 7 [Mycena kentingensis (nom. inval.)]|nr:Bromodomain-containing 7 [Mycena kentingensis (nom. inval.)]